MNLGSSCFDELRLEFWNRIRGIFLWSLAICILLTTDRRRFLRIGDFDRHSMKRKVSNFMIIITIITTTTTFLQRVRSEIGVFMTGNAIEVKHYFLILKYLSCAWLTCRMNSFEPSLLAASAAGIRTRLYGLTNR